MRTESGSRLGVEEAKTTRGIFLLLLMALCSACASSHLSEDLPRGAAAYQLMPAAGADKSLATYRISPLDSVDVNVEDGELVEITPGAVRLRKQILSESERKRADRQARDREQAATAR